MIYKKWNEPIKFLPNQKKKKRKKKKQSIQGSNRVLGRFGTFFKIGLLLFTNKSRWIIDTNEKLITYNRIWLSGWVWTEAKLIVVIIEIQG